jgi:hypothetical protein
MVLVHAALLVHPLLPAAGLHLHRSAVVVVVLLLLLFFPFPFPCLTLQALAGLPALALIVKCCPRSLL